MCNVLMWGGVSGVSGGSWVLCIRISVYMRERDEGISLLGETEKHAAARMLMLLGSALATARRI